MKKRENRRKANNAVECQRTGTRLELARLELSASEQYTQRSTNARDDNRRATAEPSEYARTRNSDCAFSLRLERRTDNIAKSDTSDNMLIRGDEGNNEEGRQAAE